MYNAYNVVVIGGGHAGIEAACAAAKTGCSVALITMDTNKIGMASCNPSIGGTAKGHIVREIDALGGAMGQLADKAGIHFKMLNRSKGPAVWSPRCQIDKDLYPVYAYDYLEKHKNITVIEETAIEIIVDNYTVRGVRLMHDDIIAALAVVFCPGTFLNGVMYTGMKKTRGGRYGESPSDMISQGLQSMGFKVGRLKTGTPPRISAKSVDFSQLEAEEGDIDPQPFSFFTDKVENKIKCYQTMTTERCHEILRMGFDQSPMFRGEIKGVGPRYCPSIEDKISRFADHPNHKIVLEPEGLNTDSIYVNGFSTSLPAPIQQAGLRELPGLEFCKILRYGYAIEYDYFPSYQLFHTLESKNIRGLYFAGQVNGSSGYEEAAGQGLIAGANAGLKIMERDPLELRRDEAYIGVMIDDLVNKCSDEPYRMFTSLAEYRLLLRQDNAEARLHTKATKAGLLTEEHRRSCEVDADAIKLVTSQTKIYKLIPEKANLYLNSIGESPIDGTTSIYNLLKRVNTRIEDLFALYDYDINLIKQKIFRQVETNIKYEGYIKHQLAEAERFKENESKYIPVDFDYSKVKSLSAEAMEKLIKIRPTSFGQISRIPGISATDMSIISVFLKK